jgi:hypothetical protein
MKPSTDLPPIEQVQRQQTGYVAGVTAPGADVQVQLT